MVDNTYRIEFPAQTADGIYTVRVGPAINELAGNVAGMDQNGNGLGGETEADVFVGTFAIDGTPPAVVGAFALQNGNRVGVTFNEPVLPAFATNPANYRVDGVVPTAAVAWSNGTQVALTVGPTLGDTFNLAILGASDALGNSADLAIEGEILTLTPQDIGTPGTDPRNGDRLLPSARPTSG